ncbi:uncharacterized protein LOC144884935 [Branchiostoma floridae x Branchiostoma japonicum]
MRLTLQTFHHKDGARWVVESEEEAPGQLRLKIERYHRPGAPKAGLMVYATNATECVPCGWIRDKDKDEVLNLVGEGSLSGLSCIVHDAYLKKEYYVIKVDVTM